MNLVKKIASGLLVSLLTLVVVASSASAASSVVYNAVPSTLPPNMASLGFQATQTSEFGDYVHLAGTNRVLNTVTVTMSDWALFADYSTTAPYSSNSVSWTHPITLSVYSNHLGANGVPDTLLAIKTQSVTIPWRPVGDESCPIAYGVHQWKASDGSCNNGIAFNATFDLTSLNVTLPSDVIVKIAYDTESYGVAPIGANGPYNSLNVGVEGLATIGTDDNIGNVFWNTSTAAWYTDGGDTGVGVFRQDTNWAPYGTVSMQISATPLMPSDKEQCKKDGWKTFGSMFKNQGDCVSSVVSQGKNK